MVQFSNYLSQDDFEVIITGDYTHERATIIANALCDIFIVYSKTESFILQDNITYKYTDNTEYELIPMITELCEVSFKRLTEVERNQIKNRYSKQYKAIFKGCFYSQTYKEIVKKLTRDDIKFDNTICQIHFKNGYMDLNDLTFKQREKGKQFITQYINRDYIPSTSEQRAQVLKPFKMIYPNAADFECIISYFGSALSGKSTKDQDILFLLGLGSSGKSFILNLTCEAIGCYFKELNDDTFSLGNKNADKILNTFAKTPQIRISWVNELKDEKIDASLFKKFCDGQLTTTQLYKDGSFTVPHYSKAIITANTMPNIKIDTGISRRFKGFTHQSNFTNKQEDIDEASHIYKVDVDLLEKLIKANLLDAWFDILATACNGWLQGKKTQYTANFEETRDAVLMSNDWIQDFIDSNLKITNNESDRIGKTTMYDALKSQNPNKHISLIQLISSLKDKKIRYNAKYRCDKMQGCFVGVLFQDGLDDETSQDDPLDKGTETNYKSKYENAMKEIEDLKKQLQQLQQQQQPPQMPVAKATKQTKNIVIKETHGYNSLLSIKNDADAMDAMIDAML
ncbi:MAG: hypothetical protein EBZ58_10220 [Bacteroidetes bacterium]|nr:hypothetical protein [Bacteroidota bacterium]